MHLVVNSLAGDARNEVMTTSELSKLRFDPAIYRANALQGLVYDPARESDKCILLYTSSIHWNALSAYNLLLCDKY